MLSGEGHQLQQLFEKDNKMALKGKKTGFTIVELLTVMSIIVILLSLLLPSLNMVRRYSKKVVQKNQFRNIDSGLQLYLGDFDEYPDSSPADVNGDGYCGAMKLCEIMAGRDGLGYHLDSKLTADDGSGKNELYPQDTEADITQPEYQDNLRKRKEYLEPKDIRICSLLDLYAAPRNFAESTDELRMLCDVFRSVRNRTTGKRMGMPILYYRADTSKLFHNISKAPTNENIYNYLDNRDLLENDETKTHPLFKLSTGAEGEVFYENTLNEAVAPIERPYNKDSYILISAGWDGIYGTKDDVYNFAK